MSTPVNPFCDSSPAVPPIVIVASTVVPGVAW